MKVVILAGGLGTRLSEETQIRPKPMVEIGGIPIIEHIMQRYALFGHKEFIILLGYKGNYIKNYFREKLYCQGNISIDFGSKSEENWGGRQNDWKVHLIDTGEHSLTSSRVIQAQELLNDETFFLTYGDGLSDINFDKLLKHHKENDGVVTLSSVQPKGRFGNITFSENKVLNFREKSTENSGWINGGFFVCEKEVFDYLTPNTMLEDADLPNIAEKGKLVAYKHTGFWQCMDTLSDKNALERIYRDGNPSWMKK